MKDVSANRNPYKQLGLRQLAILKALRRSGPMTTSQLAEKCFGSRHRLEDTRNAMQSLERRGLVTLERTEGGIVATIVEGM